MKTVLGLDLGTQSLKAVFYEYESKQFAAVVSSPLAVDQDQSGKAEQQAEWWLKALADCMAQVSNGIKASVQAIAISGQQHGFVPVDKDGKVLAPVKLWCDTATQQEVEDITRNCGGKANAIEISGNPVVTGYTSPKILWLKKNLPDAYRQMAHILLPHDYLNYVLTGEYSMEYGDASGTGLLDVRSRRWSKEMLRAVDADRDLSECLPKLFAENEIVGYTTEDVATTYGLPQGVPVATGGGDNMMGAIGTGNVAVGEMTISLGSSGTLYAYSNEPVIDPDGNIAAFCSSTGGWLPLLCTMNCTLATELMRDTLDVPLEKFETLAAAVPPGCDGLITLPFFNGERTPNLPRGKGCLIGLDSRNCSKAHILRSAIEATSFSLKFGFDELTKLGLKASNIVLTGGGSKNAVWRQIIADVFQLPVTVLKAEEGASFGAALQALWVLQKQEQADLSIADVCRQHIEHDTERAVQPNTANADVYRKVYANYQRILKQVAPVFG